MLVCPPIPVLAETDIGVRDYPGARNFLIGSSSRYLEAARIEGGSV